MYDDDDFPVLLPGKFTEMDGGRPMGAACDPVFTRFHLQYGRPSVRFQGYCQVQSRDVAEDTEDLCEIQEQTISDSRMSSVMVCASMACACDVIEQLLMVLLAHDKK